MQPETIEEAARLVGLRPPTIWKYLAKGWIHRVPRGDLPKHLWSDRHTYVDVDEVREFRPPPEMGGIEET